MTMQPCIVCAKHPDRSAVGAVFMVNGVAYCEEHMPQPKYVHHEGLVDSETPEVREAHRALAEGSGPFDSTVDAREMVNHPDHYGGANNPYEVIKVLDAWGLDEDAYLWNTVKYIARAGKKDPTKELEDLKKARFYLDHAIKMREEP